MTLDELNNYHNLVQQIATKERQIEALRRNLGPKSPSVDGMPHGTGISDRTANLSIEIADLEERLEYQRQQARAEKPKITAFIGSIDDDITRLVFRFRVLYGYTWTDIAATLGGYNTEGSVRKRYFNYFC
jgi:hypothetical protein